MSLNTKYNNEQREIMREIDIVKRKQRYYRNKWLDLDVELGALKKLLNDQV